MAEAELASLVVKARKYVEFRQALIEMGLPQHHTLTQVVNATEVGVVTDNVIPKQTKSM